MQVVDRLSMVAAIVSILGAPRRSASLSTSHFPINRDIRSRVGLITSTIIVLLLRLSSNSVKPWLEVSILNPLPLAWTGAGFTVVSVLLVGVETGR